MFPRTLINGVGLQIVALLTGYVFSRYLYGVGWLASLLISVPLFLASLFYLLRAPAPLAVRLLLSCWVLAIPAYHAAIYAWECRQIQTEVYLIPDGYQGKVTVFFGAGADEEREADRVIFRIGVNGECRTRKRLRRFSKREPNEARAERREFYLVKPTGERRRLERGSDLQAEQIVVFPSGENWDGEWITSVDFYVGCGVAIRKAMGLP